MSRCVIGHSLRQFATFSFFAIAGIIPLSYIYSYLISQLQNSSLLISEEAVMPNSADTMIEKLYHDHHGWLFAWLRKKLSCPHHAADIAQDTFTRLLAMSHLPFLETPRA